MCIYIYVYIYMYILPWFKTWVHVWCLLSRRVRRNNRRACVKCSRACSHVILTGNVSYAFKNHYIYIYTLKYIYIWYPHWDPPQSNLWKYIWVYTYTCTYTSTYTYIDIEYQPTFQSGSPFVAHPSTFSSVWVLVARSWPLDCNWFTGPMVNGKILRGLIWATNGLCASVYVCCAYQAIPMFLKMEFEEGVVLKFHFKIQFFAIMFSQWSIFLVIPSHWQADLIRLAPEEQSTCQTEAAHV